MKGVFITATGTGVGKTWLSSALTSAFIERGATVASIKPMETGVDPDPMDAIELARACGQSSLAYAEGLYRAAAPLAPYAVEKTGGLALGSLDALATRTLELSEGADFAIIEGAGGVLVPLNRQHTIADFAARLGLPAVLVARDALGVLSYTLTAVEALHARKVNVAAIVLNQADEDAGPDISHSSNADVLADYLAQIPILRVPRVQRIEDMREAAHELRELLES